MEPIYRRVYEQVRSQILDGRLSPGQRVPATRALADELGVARNTVARAYEELLAEGYLVGRRGSGTYVAALGTPPAQEPPVAAAPALSAWARRAFADAEAAREPPGGLPYDFRPGTPDWDAFPRTVWWRLLGRRLRQGAQLSRYGDPGGYPPLREAIARHVAAARAAVCRPEQVVIVNGTQQAVDLLGRLLVEPGDEVVVEDPGYADARRALAAYGARLRPVRVDGEGLRTAELPEAGRARFVYVTPTHQFPTGAAMPLERRLALLEWARRSGALVLEDDAYAELRYAGRPVESLQGLDRGGNVVYLGTFSTVLFPPLRIGYAVLPPGLVAPFTRAKWLADRGTDLLEQQALADFLAEGHFARHLRRMRRLGRERRDALLDALRRHLGDRVHAPPTDTGLYLMARIDGVEERALVDAALERGVALYPVGPSYVGPAPEGAGLLLGFGALGPAAVEEGVQRLAEAVAVSSRGTPAPLGSTAATSTFAPRRPGRAGSR
ncbi:MAG TPA: PLP-dependent aminotransferase family protein [Chloroflexota bacterium]|nr:PLP-dependent aminotransferase family protein [Chloroflexota bacterium]